MKKLVPTAALDCRRLCGIRVLGGFLRKLGGKKKKAYVRLQRKVKGSGVCGCVFNKRKDSSMKGDVRNTIRLTHLSPASRLSWTVRGCYASATNTQGTQKCLEMTTYLAEKELQNIQSDQCGWKKEHHVQV